MALFIISAASLLCMHILIACLLQVFLFANSKCNRLEATLEVIQKRKTEKAEVQDADREAALQYASSLSSHVSPLFFIGTV